MSSGVRASRLRRGTLVAVAVGALLVGAALLRLSGSDWDEGRHLHPDERYVAIVADAVDLPSSPWSYFEVDSSPLSPYNTEQGRDYLYGTLPLLATKTVAVAAGRDGYGDLYLVGRWLSAVVDLGTLVLVLLLARLLLGPAGRNVAIAGGVLAAGLYAVTVTAVQHAHFATVESWLTFFATLTVYLAARAARRPIDPGWRLEPGWAAVGAALGLTAACKVSGLLAAVAVAVALAGRTVVAGSVAGVRDALVRLTGASLLVAVTGYVAFRLVSPYTFASSSWLDLSLNSSFRDALERQREALDGAFLFPPSYQWLLSLRFWDPLENLVVWQLGVPLGVAALAGTGVLAVYALRLLVSAVRAAGARAHSTQAIADAVVPLSLLTYLGVSFFRFAGLFAHTGRYLVPLAPILAVAASFALVWVLRARPRFLAAAVGVVGVATVAYAVAFHAIYRDTTTRVAASRWLVANVSEGRAVANEHWDDSLPAGGDAQRFRGVTVPVFDPDDEAKLRKLHDALDAADYYVLSSPRAWRTIGRLPNRFPLMVRFYETLFAGRLGFQEVASFRSPPRLFGVELDDLDAEEAFWVYDHPPVRIFRNTGRLDLAGFRAALCGPPRPPGCEPHGPAVND